MRNKNPFFFIFIFFAFMAVTGGKLSGLIFPMVLGYVLYKMFNRNKNNDGRQRQRNERRERRTQRRDYRRNDTDFDRNQRAERSTRRARTERREEPRKRRTRTNPERNVRRSKPKDNPYKKSGMEKYKEYDYNGAIEDFEKSLTVDDSDIATHFNIACAHSIMEAKDKAFYHLSKAVELGFKDFEKIKTHDALAYLRIQDEFETFTQNGYQLKSGDGAKQEKITEHGDLLEQLNKLAELREKGLLTEEEFSIQKKKLLG